MARKTSENISILAGASTIALVVATLAWLWSPPANAGMRLYAEFTSVEGLNIGANVRFAGIDVGRVLGFELALDGQSVVTAIEVELLETPSGTPIQIPVDSAIAIQTDGLVGEKFLQILPGYEEEPLADQGNFQTAYDSILLLDLLDKIL